MNAPTSFLDQLVARGLLVPTGVSGLYARGGAFEAVVAGLERLITAAGVDDQPEVLRLPPAMPRVYLERSGYMKSFPQLAATVHAFCGGDHEHTALLGKLAAGEDWASEQPPTDIALTPAACYPIYPMLAAQGPLPSAGRLFDIESYCFRREPSADPARMQCFRMHEYVMAGTDEQVLSFRQRWIDRSMGMIGALALPYEVVPANDPFFGRAGRMLKANQRDQGFKLEMVIPVAGPQPTACLSFNYHQDHFAETWGIDQANGERAHSGCVGFGLERLTLGLFRHHGLATAAWPSAVRDALQV